MFDYRYKTISTKDEHELEKISHKLRNILICPKRWPRLGRLRKTIIMIHSCSFQYFLNQIVLIKLKHSIIHCPLYKCLRTQATTLTLSVTNYSWNHSPWDTSQLYEYLILTSPPKDNYPHMPRKSKSYTWTFKGYTFITKKPQYNRPIHKVSYNNNTYLARPYITLFNLGTTSYCNPLLLRLLVSSMNICQPLGISTSAKEFVKSIFWLYKTRIL